jgi:hypothetical protein
MSQASEWPLFIARPGNNRQHLVRDAQGEPRIIFSDDDGTRINDRLARYIVDSLNSGLNPEDPNPDEGWFLESPEEGEPDPAIVTHHRTVWCLPLCELLGIIAVHSPSMLRR